MKDVATCDKLRWASKQAVTRRFPNGETHPPLWAGTLTWIYRVRRDYAENWNILVPAENKSTEIPLVVTSEQGIAQTLAFGEGVVGLQYLSNLYKWRTLESVAIEGNGPVI